MITVKDAIRRTGKAQFTINSFCQKYKDTQYIKIDKNKYYIDENYLFNFYPEINNGQLTAINEPLVMINNDLHDVNNGQLTAVNGQLTAINEPLVMINSDLQNINNKQLTAVNGQLTATNYKQKKRLRKLRLKLAKQIEKSIVSSENLKANEKLIAQLTAINGQLTEELKQKNKEINELHYMIQTIQVQRAITQKADSFWKSIKKFFVVDDTREK